MTIWVQSPAFTWWWVCGHSHKLPSDFHICMHYSTKVHIFLIVCLFFMYSGVLSTCMSMWGCGIPWNGSYRQLCAAMGVLGIEAPVLWMSSSALDRWAIPPASGRFSVSSFPLQALPVHHPKSVHILYVTQRLKMFSWWESDRMFL